MKKTPHTGSEKFRRMVMDAINCSEMTFGIRAFVLGWPSGMLLRLVLCGRRFEPRPWVFFKKGSFRLSVALAAGQRIAVCFSGPLRWPEANALTLGMLPLFHPSPFPIFNVSFFQKSYHRVPPSIFTGLYFPNRICNFSKKPIIVCPR